MGNYTGVDEAGYGPLIGPLAIMQASVACDDETALAEALAIRGVRDSKQVHTPKDLSPLESVALAGLTWLTGFQPDTAADAFALVGETVAMRQDIPWAAQAESLRLPVKAAHVDDWRIAAASPLGLRGTLVHPSAFNAARRAGLNRAKLELDHLRPLLQAPWHLDSAAIVVDRLGGRRYYRDFLSTVWPEYPVDIVEEVRGVSSYSFSSAPGCSTQVQFRVKADAHSALCALASCIAKYLRELHMELLNRYWCRRHRWLKPTAGYYRDARRWLYQIGSGPLNAHADHLIRCDPADIETQAPAHNG